MTDVWDFPPISVAEKTDGGGHATVKPQALLCRILNSKPGRHLVLSAFGGDGSDLVACESRGRL